MTCTEAYKEHIEYTFNAFCRVVIYYAAINAWRDRDMRRQREISFEYVFDIFVAVFYVQTTPFRVSVLCVEFSAVMVDRSFPCHNADSPLQSISLSPYRVMSAGYGA